MTRINVTRKRGMMVWRVLMAVCLVSSLTMLLAPSAGCKGTDPQQIARVREELEATRASMAAQVAAGQEALARAQAAAIAAAQSGDPSAIAAAEKQKIEAEKALALTRKLHGYVETGITTFNVAVDPSGNLNLTAVGTTIGGAVGGPAGAGIGTLAGSVIGLIVGELRRARAVSAARSIVNGVDAMVNSSDSAAAVITGNADKMKAELTPLAARIVKTETLTPELKKAA